MNRLTPIIGTPWAVPCNPPHSFDCWELVRYVRGVYGFRTPSYVDRVDRAPKHRKIITEPPKGWHQLSSPETLCVARIGKSHVGVWLAHETIIHSQLGSGVRVDSPVMLGLTGPVTYWELTDA